MKKVALALAHPLLLGLVDAGCGGSPRGEVVKVGLYPWPEGPNLYLQRIEANMARLR